VYAWIQNANDEVLTWRCDVGVKAPDLTGQRFGRLVVVSREENGKGGRARWSCQCDCGSETVVRAKDLRAGHTRSCGCIQREAARANGASSATHGHCCNRRSSPTYISWESMRKRCDNSKSDSFASHGGRGIKVCDRWKSFGNFLEDMGECPPGLTLERLDNDLGYSPDNCSWETQAVQNRNKRNNRWLTFRGETKIITDWATTLGISKKTLQGRLYRGWGIEVALTAPVHVRRLRNQVA
jgi:hypothetical protein